MKIVEKTTQSSMLTVSGDLSVSNRSAHEILQPTESIQLTDALPIIVDTPVVKAARLRNANKVQLAQPGILHVSLELCPLYLPGPMEQSKLDPAPTGEESIETSRVGAKWITIKHLLHTLGAYTRSQGVKLDLRATFGDIGVLVATKQDRNAELVRQHSDIYRRELQALCEKEGISLTYQNLSEVAGPVKPSHAVDPFVVGETSPHLPTNTSTEELIQLLDLTHIPVSGRRVARRNGELLTHALELCGGNVNVWRGLIHTYLHYVQLAAQGTDLHIGLERANWLLAIQSFDKGSALEQMPALHIEVA